MGISVGRITTLWEIESALSDGQYGFRRARNTESPTSQVINALEEAAESATEIHESSWDIRRAFDSVPKSILTMSWERLGVPRHVADFIVNLDRGCLAVLLTLHAKYISHTIGRSAFSLEPSSPTNARGFHGVTGTSQGDTPSPSNWTAALDILLRPWKRLILLPSTFAQVIHFTRCKTQHLLMTSSLSRPAEKASRLRLTLSLLLRQSLALPLPPPNFVRLLSAGALTLPAGLMAIINSRYGICIGLLQLSQWFTPISPLSFVT